MIRQFPAFVAGLAVGLCLSASAALDNTPFLWARDIATVAQTPRLPEQSPAEKALIAILPIIELGRQVADFSRPEAQRRTLARAYLEQTDPVTRPVELGGAP